MSGPSIQWSQRLWEAIIAWLEEAYPEEGCGLVVREPEGDAAFRRCENVIDRYHEHDPEQYPRTARDFYMIDPREFLKVEERGEKLEAIVHSHPDAGDYFSDADVDAALMPGSSEDDPVEPLYPGADYLVVSVRQGKAVQASLYRFDGAAEAFERVRRWPEASFNHRPAGEAVEG